MDGNKEKRVFFGGGSSAELIDRALSSMNEALGFIPSTTKQRKRGREKKMEEFQVIPSEPL